jgi:hypothetical protein
MWELERDVILQVLPELDGHSISHPSLFAKAGFPDALVKALTIVHKEDLQRGISDLEALFVIAETIGADSRVSLWSKRGEAAEQLKNAIRLKLSGVEVKRGV